jgi:bifunctional non-homologous end joining protein LigD
MIIGGSLVLWQRNRPAKFCRFDGQEVQITNPEKLYFSSQIEVTKLELVQYYLSVARGALAGIQNRPIVLKRFVNGAEAEAFYQKRAPEKGDTPPPSVVLSNWACPFFPSLDRFVS